MNQEGKYEYGTRIGDSVCDWTVCLINFPIFIDSIPFSVVHFDWVRWWFYWTYVLFNYGLTTKPNQTYNNNNKTIYVKKKESHENKTLWLSTNLLNFSRASQHKLNRACVGEFVGAIDMFYHLYSFSNIVHILWWDNF